MDKISIGERVRIVIARMSLARGFVWTLKCLTLVFAAFGFFYLVRSSDLIVSKACQCALNVLRFAYEMVKCPCELSGAQVLAGLLMLLPLGVIILIQIWHFIFHRHEEPISGRFRYVRQESDDPIADEDKDELGRRDYVSHIAAILDGEYGGFQALYLGIYGEWGEGKSSIMNLVRKRMEKKSKIVFVDFKSWEHESRDDLPYVLFAQIARTVADRLDLRLAFLLIRYAIFLVPRRLLGIAGPVEWVVDLFLRIMNAFTSADRLQKEIGGRLNELGAKIAIIVDDIDRLESEDLRAALRILRTAGDIHRFVYCLLTSRNHMIKAVSKMFDYDAERSEEDAAAYVQKILHLELDLPPIDASVLEDRFKAKLNSTLKGYGLPVLPNIMPSMELFRARISNYREMLRLHKELVVRIGFYRAVCDSKFPVNIDDLIALSIVHLYDSEFWRAIYVNRDYIMPHEFDWLEERKTLPASEVEQTFGLLNGDDCARYRGMFLANYLGIRHIEDGARNEYQVEIDEVDAERNFRLMSAKCFSAYFKGEIPYLAELEFVDRVEKMAGEDEELLRYFQSQNERGILMRCLEYLQDVIELQDENKRQSYLRVLARLSDKIFKPERPFERDIFGIRTNIRPADRFARCALAVLYKTYKEGAHEVGGELLRAIQATDSIVLLAALVRKDDRKRNTRAERANIFTDDDYASAADLFLKRVKNLQVKGMLVGHAQEEDIRRTWRVLITGGRIVNEGQEEVAYHSMMANDVALYPNVLHVLLPYRYYADRSPKEYSPLYFDALDEEIGVDKVQKTLSEAPEEECGEGIKQIIVNFNAAINTHNTTNAWPDVDSQRDID